MILYVGENQIPSNISWIGLEPEWLLVRSGDYDLRALSTALKKAQGHKANKAIIGICGVW